MTTRQVMAAILAAGALLAAAAPALGADWELILEADGGCRHLGPIALTVDEEGPAPLSLYYRQMTRRYELRLGFMPVDWGPAPGENLLFGDRARLPLLWFATDFSGFEILPAMHYETFYARLSPGGAGRYLIGRRYTVSGNQWEIGLTETALLSGDFSPYYLIPYPFFPLSVCKVFLDRSRVGDSRDANLLYGLDYTRTWGDLSAYIAFMADEIPLTKSWDGPWRVGLQIGAERQGVLGRDDLALSAEYTAISRYAFTYYEEYEDGDYQSGGRPLGHSLGPDADLLRLRLTKDFQTWRGWCELARERHGEGRFREDRWDTADGRDLAFLTGTVEASYWLNLGFDISLGECWRLKLEAGAAGVKNEGNVPGAAGSAARAAVKMAYSF